MAHKHNSNGYPFVALDEDGFLKLFTKNGDLVDGNIFLRVQDDMDASNVVIGKFLVNIVKDRAEMEECIKKYKEESPYRYE